MKLRIAQSRAVALLLALFLSLASPRATFAADPPPQILVPATPPLEAEALKQAIVDGRERVREFVEIRKLAQNLGLRVWLFGGAAAGFGHYVKSDELRKIGSGMVPPGRLNYRLGNIFYVSQDVDLVVDGPVEDKEKFEKELQRKFNFLLPNGKKSKWEVRSLRHTIGDKEALLGNPDYLKQHLDSQSTGMIELTEPPPGQAVIRDFKTWDGDQTTPFFEDLRSGVIRYYYSPEHETTSRFRAGQNPPVISVVRYLTKAFQYNLTIPHEDYGNLQKSMQHTQQPWAKYVGFWLAANAPKLVTHSQSVERSLKIVEDLGLSKYENIPMLRKKALPSFPVGQVKPLVSVGTLMGAAGPVPEYMQGTGQTAAELGLSQLSHATDTRAAFEAITRSNDGHPNALASRPDTPGETARFGEAFYVMNGGRFSGHRYRIPLLLDPGAREGTDFERVGRLNKKHDFIGWSKFSKENFIKILNRNAVTLRDSPAIWQAQNHNRSLGEACGAVFGRTASLAWKMLTHRMVIASGAILSLPLLGKLMDDTIFAYKPNAKDLYRLLYLVRNGWIPPDGFIQGEMDRFPFSSARMAYVGDALDQVLRTGHVHPEANVKKILPFIKDTHSQMFAAPFLQHLSGPEVIPLLLILAKSSKMEIRGLGLRIAAQMYRAGKFSLTPAQMTEFIQLAAELYDSDLNKEWQSLAESMEVEMQP